MKHTNRRRSWISVLLAVLVFAGAVTMPILQTEVKAVTQHEIDRKKAEKAALSKKIKEQQALMNSLQSEQADMLTQKEALDQQQDLKIQEINAVQEELAMYRQLILDKAYEARIAQEHAEEQLELYKNHIRSMEEQGIGNMYLQLLFSSESMTDLLSRVDMVSEIMEYDKRVHDNYVSAKNAALQAKLEYEAAAAELEVQEVELQSEIDRLTGELSVLQTELDRLRADIDGYASVIKDLEAGEVTTEGDDCTLARIAGLGGGAELLGTQYRLINGYAAGYGFDGVAMALIGQPQILFLDEPTLGLDVLARHDLWNVIRALKGRITIILTTHYMEEAEALSDRIGIMKDGRLLAVGAAEELKKKAGTDDFERAFVTIVKEVR